MVEMALKDTADAMGDVDAFIAQYEARTRKVLQIAAEIAARLLAAGRAEESRGAGISLDLFRRHARV